MKALLDNPHFDRLTVQRRADEISLDGHWRIQAQDPSVLPAVGIEHSEGLRLDVPTPKGWVRLLQRFTFTSAPTLELTLVAAGRTPTGTPAVIEWIEILQEMRHDGLAFHTRIASSVVLREDASETTFRFAPSADPKVKAYWFCVQLAAAGEYHLLELTLAPPRARPQRLETYRREVARRIAAGDDVAAQPLRRVRGSIGSGLANTLAQTSHGIRAGDPTWFLRYAEAALRFECFDITRGALRQVEAEIDALSPADATTFVILGLRVLFAEGNHEATQRFVRRYALRADARSPRLRTLLSLLPNGFDASCDLVLSDSTLNLAAVSACGADPGALLRALGDARVHVSAENRALIAASVYGASDPSTFQYHFNQFLRLRGCPTVCHVEPSARRLIDALVFEPSPVVVDGPLVSVIVAAFCAESTLRGALRSLTAQTYANLEILVCDDASNDETLAIALDEARRDPRIRVFRSEQNQGPYNIRNALLLAARGDFRTFHDADDVALPTRIEEQARCHATSGAPAVFANMLRISDSGAIAFFGDHIAHRPALVTLFAHRSLFDTFGPFRSSLCAADSEYYERIRDALGDDAIEVVDKPLLLAGWSEASLTGRSELATTEVGYRSPARRDYAQAVGRQRALGTSLVPDTEVNAVLLRHSIYRAPCPVAEVS